MPTTQAQLSSVGQLIGMRTSQIAGQISDFIRTNPIASGITVGGTVLGGLTAIQIVRRTRKKRKKAVRRKTTTRKRATRRRAVASRRRKRRIPTGKRHKSHSKPRHAGHKVVSFRTKGGQMVRFKVKAKRRKR